MDSLAKSVTVIIPTCDRPASLVRCLESLQDQTWLPQEIIVVNDGDVGVDAPRARVIKTAGHCGAAMARNLGVQSAATEWVAFIDDDCVADPRWLEKLVGALQEGDEFGFGRTVYRTDGYRGYFPEKLTHNSNGQWPGGANLIFRRASFNQLGGFDPKFWEYQNEDTELALRAVAAGQRYVRASEAVVYHQASWWTVASLLKSAKNLSVWVRLKQLYPDSYQEFGSPMLGAVLAPGDYMFLLLIPMVVPAVLVWLVLLIRYEWLGGRDLRLFVAKWPVWLLARRWWVWREAWQRRTVVI